MMAFRQQQTSEASQAFSLTQLICIGALLVVATTLHGCDGGAAAKAPENAEVGLKLVSQTFNGIGKMTMKNQPPQPPLPESTIKVSLMLDMEAVRYRMDENVFVNMSQYNITSTTRMSVIFEASTKRFTMFQDQEMSGPAPKSTKTCTFGSFPTLHEPAVVGKCIQDALANSKPVGSEGGLQKYEMHLPVPGSQTDAGTEAFYLDKDNVLKKVILDMTVANMTEHMELTDLDAKAGTPDASIFTPPEEWGKCTEMAVPPPPPGMPPSFQALIKCVGISTDYVSEIVV